MVSAPLSAKPIDTDHGVINQSRVWRNHCKADEQMTTQPTQNAPPEIITKHL